MADRTRRLAVLWISSIFTVGLLGMPAAVAAESAPTALPVPTAEEGALDGEARLDDGPRPGPAEFDTDAAGEAALDQVDRFDDADWDISALAAALGDDADGTFEFVRDDIGYDPYGGVLRGAQGTLAARSGSAWDRALLLQAILVAQGHETRIASAALDASIVPQLRERASQTPDRGFADPEVEAVIGLDLDGLSARARRDHARLESALAGLSLGSVDRQDGVGSAAARHAWVQRADADGAWIDLDPTLLDSAPGDTLAVAADTGAAPGDDDLHRIDIRLIVESLADGMLEESTVLETSLVAADNNESEIWLTFHPQGSGAGAILADILDEATWVPVLSVDGEDLDGAEFELGGSGSVSDFFGGGGADLAGLRLELTSIAPGTDPIVATRMLVDRISPSLRAGGTVVAEQLDPLPPSGVPAALSGMHQLLISTGGADLRSHAVGRAIALGYGADLANEPGATDGLPLRDILYPLAVANRDLVIASERALIGGIDEAEPSRVFVQRPRAYLVSLEPFSALDDGTAITIDLALDDLGVVAAADAEAGVEARIRLWYGVLQTALETELSLERTRAVDPASVVVSSVSLAADGPPTLVLPDQIDDVDPDAGALREALRAGDLALVVGDARTSNTFWAVDPVSGQTRSIAEPGIRIGSIGGGNYVNSSGGGPRYVVDPKTGRSMGTIRNGKFTPTNRPPPNRCQGGTEYVVILGCVSIPAGMTVGMANGVVVTAIVSWATVIIRLL